MLDPEFSSEFFADAMLHESIRVSGTPYRLSNFNSRPAQDDKSDIQSDYNTM